MKDDKKKEWKASEATHKRVNAAKKYIEEMYRAQKQAVHERRKRYVERQGG